jgi:hypothetical protein
MRFFLDMNIPIFFCLELGNPLEEKAKKFVESKRENSFLFCHYILDINLPKWLKRQQVILFEFNQKVQNSEYTLFSSEQSIELFPKDKMIIERLVKGYLASKNKDNFKQRINEVYILLGARINYFIKKYIDEIVIPEVDQELKSCLLDWLNLNDSDAKTIASAIQENNEKELEIMTADKKDWKKEILEEIHNHPKLKKKYPKLPKINYLQDL